MVWSTVPGTGPGTPWGRAAVSVPAAPILAEAGPKDGATGLRVTLTGADGSGGPPFSSGDPAILAADPVRLDLSLPGADWHLAGIPADGWTARPGPRWPIRLLTLLAAALIVGPMMHTRRLTEERQKNILDLRDREAQLRQLSRRLGLALDASKVGVWDYDLDTGELVWDDRMDELYVYPPTGRRQGYADWQNRLHPDDVARAEAEFREAVEATGRYASDYRLRLPDGSVRHIRAIGAVFRELEASAKIIGVNWDVTADVLRSEELDARRVEAEGASIAKSQFLATMSHEIRTPMNGVIGMLDLILRTDLEPIQRERAGIARDSARQLLEILNDVLDLSKLEANRITLDRAPADVARVTRDVVALMAPGASGRDLEVRASIAPEVPAWVSCDATRLRQVLMNLVGNAVKFTETGTVEASVGYSPRNGGRLEIAVRDTGVGIPEDDKRNLFQRFAQVDSSVTRQRGGTGLGLAISRQLVELMGGEISMESVLGLGSTFRFWVPAPAAEAPSETASRAAADPSPVLAATPAARVLVAEDNPTNRQILAAYLAVAGHTAQMVTNGHEALTALEHVRFRPRHHGRPDAGDGRTDRRRPHPRAPRRRVGHPDHRPDRQRDGRRPRALPRRRHDRVRHEAGVARSALRRDRPQHGLTRHPPGHCPAASALSSADTGVQPSPGSNDSMASAAVSVSSPRSAW